MEQIQKKSREILRLSYQGMSQLNIAKKTHSSKTKVNQIIRIAQSLPLSSEQIEHLTDCELFNLLFPEKAKLKPNYSHIYQDIFSGTTLKEAWYKYFTRTQSQGIQYVQFAREFQQYVIKTNRINPVLFQPGHYCFVKWFGGPFQIQHYPNEKPIPTNLFMAFLPFSQVLYAEVTLNKNHDTWLRCMQHMIDRLNAVPYHIIIPQLDTRKMERHQKSRIYLTRQDKTFQKEYRCEFSERISSKKHSGIDVEQWFEEIVQSLLQSISKPVQNSLLQCQSTIGCLTQEFNCQGPEFVSISKKHLLAKEKSQMRLNPPKRTPIITNVVNRKVQDNSHVSINKCYYSVPYLFRGQSVDAKYWIPNWNGQDGTIEIYCDGVVIARHPLFPLDTKNQYSTNPDHLPDFKHQPITNKHYWLTRAKRIGTNTEQVVFNIFRSVSFEEQAYISARSIITTANKFENPKWEKACGLALEYYRAPKARQIKEYLQK